MHLNFFEHMRYTRHWDTDKTVSSVAYSDLTLVRGLTWCSALPFKETHVLQIVEERTFLEIGACARACGRHLFFTAVGAFVGVLLLVLVHGREGIRIAHAEDVDWSLTVYWLTRRKLNTGWGRSDRSPFIAPSSLIWIDDATCLASEKLGKSAHLGQPYVMQCSWTRPNWDRLSSSFVSPQSGILLSARLLILCGNLEGACALAISTNLQPWSLTLRTRREKS